MTSTKNAFTLVEIMIVVAIIGILVAIALPGFIKARDRARQNTCQENLLRIDGAMQQLVMEQNIPPSENLMAYWPDEFVGEDKYIRSRPICPSGGTYTLFTVDDYEPVQCSVRGEDVRYEHILPHILKEQELAGGGS